MILLQMSRTLSRLLERSYQVMERRLTVKTMTPSSMWHPLALKHSFNPPTPCARLNYSVRFNVNSSHIQNGHEVGSSQPQSLADVVHELVKTERTYVQKLRVLKQSYADPLRSFARNKDTAIIPAYQANTLFGNIDSLIPANEAFLADLERMLAPGGHRSMGGIGDVTRKHVRDNIQAISSSR